VRRETFASKGTSGLMPISRSTPRSSNTRRASCGAARRRRNAARALRTARYKPGNAALACTAREIGTSSHLAAEAHGLAAVQLDATTYSGAASSRKSLLRPRRVNTSRRKRSISALSNRPVGHQPAEAVDRIGPARIAAAEDDVAPPFHRQARALAARRMYSMNAGRRKVSGRNCTSSLSPVMKIRHISAVSMRLARPAARNAPELTPT
jgi:hypothetical protein